MSSLDLAAREYNHQRNFDPIVRTVLDKDFYKALMQQFMLETGRADIPVTFETRNRSWKKFRYRDHFTKKDLQEQIDHVRTLYLTKGESIWMQGNTFYGTTNIFRPAYFNRLKESVLPEVEILDDAETGDFKARTSGKWFDTTDWELFLMTIFAGLKTRAAIRYMPKWQLEVMYARAITKLFGKLQLLKLPENQSFSFSDFSTRRRHSFLWQEKAVLMAIESLGSQFKGTSNIHLAQKHSIEAVGTNAHELRMVEACRAEASSIRRGLDTESRMHNLRQSPYHVMDDWVKVYGNVLSIDLPDTYTTESFIRFCDPVKQRQYKGKRIDSKNPYIGGEEWIDFYTRNEQDPRTKIIMFTDGLDIGSEKLGHDALKIHHHYKGRCDDRYGIGTLFGNDFVDCSPDQNDVLLPTSFVCKIVEADGQPAVKFSDNISKAIGPKETIEWYKRAFDVHELEDHQPNV